MLGVFRGKTFPHSFVIWVIILIWFLTFLYRLMPGTRSSLDQFITSHSFWLFSEPLQEAENITIVAIDEESRRRLNIKWPWKRGVTADLISNIKTHSPKVIGLDIIFSGKSEVEEDDKLAGAIASPPAVILGYILNPDTREKPLEEFIEAAASIGFVNKPLKTGVLDRTRTHYVNSNGEAEFSLDVEILRNYLGVDKSAVNITRQGISLGNRLFIPSEEGVTSLNYLVHPLRFRIIPAYLVLENKVDPSYFRDKIVLIGATDPILHDEFMTPMGVFPGVTIIGNSLAMFLSERFVSTVPAWIGYILIFSIGLVFLIAGSGWIRLAYSLIFVTVAMALVYASFFYFRSIDLKLPYMAITFSCISAYLIPNFYRYLNLIYLSGRLKDLALKDPVTGLDTPRFFYLRLDKKLRSDESICFAAIRIRNYNRLTIELSFDEIKSISRILSMIIRSQVITGFKNAEFTRLTSDTFGIMAEAVDRNKFKDYISSFITNVENSKVELDGRKMTIYFQGCIIFKQGNKAVTDANIISQMEDMFRGMKAVDILEEELCASDQHQKQDNSMDVLDFIAWDWEERNKELENHIKEVLEANKKLNRLNWGTLMALARTVDAKSSWTAGHSERVTNLALKTGRRMGMSQEDLDNLQRAGLLHDIGKIGVPQEILDKPGRLTEEEYRAMREHPEKGALILEPIEDYSEIIPLIRQHHEWFNGNGYPMGLRGVEITPGARILSLADVFDALISDRPYRPGMPVERVIRLIEEGVGTQFDPAVVDAFLGVIMQSSEISLQPEAVQMTSE